MLFRQGERFDYIYAVRSGSVKTSVSGRGRRLQITGFHFAGEPFGTYLVEWRYGEGKDLSLGLAVAEIEKAAGQAAGAEIQRVSLAGRPSRRRCHCRN